MIAEKIVFFFLTQDNKHETKACYKYLSSMSMLFLITKKKMTVYIIYIIIIHLLLYIVRILTNLTNFGQDRFRLNKKKKKTKKVKT